MMSLGIQRLSFCFTFLLSLIGSIYIIRQTKLLNGISKLTVIRKRYSSITKVIVIVSLFLILFVFLLQSALIAFIEWIDNDRFSDILTIIFSVFDVICFHGILYLTLLRFWLMYFDVQYTISTLDKEGI